MKDFVNRRGKSAPYVIITNDNAYARHCRKRSGIYVPTTGPVIRSGYDDLTALRQMLMRKQR